MIEIPKTNTLILDKRNPLQTVRVFRQEQYRYLDQETLYFYQGEFYSWNGSRYRVLDQQQIRTELYKFLDAAMVQEVGGTYIPFRPDQRQVNLVIDALRAQCNVPAEAAPPCWQSNDPHLPPAHEVLPCANGLLHLPTSMLSPATPAFFSMNVCSLTWKPNAPKPERWLKFLNELWRNDPESIRVLQQWFGYCLTSDTRQQKILLIVGPKRSGKGTIANVLTKLVGNDNVTGPTLNKFAAEFGLQSMIGRSLAIIPDARLGRRSDETVIVERLLSISGEDLLNIPRKYLQDWIGQLSTRVMMLTNELPQLHDSSGALSSRMLILVLSQSFFGREDIELRKCEFSRSIDHLRR